jgi:hypothetical protein
MKKIFFSLLLVATVGVAGAQVTVYRATNMPMTTEVFPGTTVPVYIVSSFDKEYPGVTILSWDPVRTYWRASYNKDNRIIYVFYDERGVNYRASLPVLQNNVSEDVVSTALRVHGPIVYGITKLKGANDTEVYQVRLLDNGTTKLVWMNADGTTAADVFKVKTEEVIVNQ